MGSQTNNDNSTSDDYITGDDGPDFTSELYSGEDFVTLNIAQTGTEEIEDTLASSVTFSSLVERSALYYNSSSSFRASLFSSSSSSVDSSGISNTNGGTWYPTSLPTTLALWNNSLLYNISMSNYSDVTLNFDYTNLTKSTEVVSSTLKVTVDCASAGLEDAPVLFTLYHDTNQILYGDSHGEIARLNYTTKCKRKYPSTHSYYCPDSNDIVTAVCDGTKETIITQCPQVERSSACTIIDSATGSLTREDDASRSPYNCTKVVEFSDSNKTVCQCSMCGGSSFNAGTSTRRLSDGTTSSSFDEDSLEVVVTTSYSTTDMNTVIQPAPTSFFVEEIGIELACGYGFLDYVDTAYPVVLLVQRSIVQGWKGAKYKTKTQRVLDENEAVKGMRRGVLDGIGIGPDSSAYVSGKVDTYTTGS